MTAMSALSFPEESWPCSIIVFWLPLGHHLGVLQILDISQFQNEAYLRKNFGLGDHGTC